MPPVEVSGQGELTLWRIPELDLELEFPVALMADIVAAAKEGFNRFPRGGLEVGGVLFGRREGGRIRVLAARSIPCKHLLGPSFALSAEEHEELSALLLRAREQPELAGLAAVGWYHSHTRSGLTYSDGDAHLHNRHFSQPWQIGLLLRPEVGKPTQIALFVRGKDGELPLRPVLVIGEDSLAVGEGPGKEQVARQPERDAARRASSAAVPRRMPRAAWALPVAALAALVAGAIGFRGLAWPEWELYWRRVIDYWWPPSVEAGQRPFQLAVAADNGKLTVRWDPAAPGLRTSAGATLEVWDGDQQKEVPLDAPALERGSFEIDRRSDRVRVTMTVADGPHGPLRETALLVGAPPGPSPEELTSRSRLIALREERERLERALKARAAELEALIERRALLERQLATPAPRQPPPVARSQPELVEKAPAPAAAGVVLEQRPPAISSPGSSGAASLSPPAPPMKPEAGPNAGRLIWTGALSPGRVLSISGRQASTGTLTGQFPGVPVRVRTYPAELSRAGLIVYTSNPKYAGAEQVEPPGPENSWTRTVYRYAPERADSLQLVAAPSAANGWQGITLRANTTLTAIVVDWEILR
jgi:proteasome lid subunit RPN8/RPN11